MNADGANFIGRKMGQKDGKKSIAVDKERIDKDRKDRRQRLPTKEFDIGKIDKRESPLARSARPPVRAGCGQAYRIAGRLAGSTFDTDE